MAEIRDFAFKSAAVLTLVLAMPGCDWMKKKDPPGAKTKTELAAERDRRLRTACASPGTYDRLKEIAFDQAARIRNQDPRDLDGLAEASVVRMEQPVLKSRDDALNVTVCTGRFILELPPGSENAFDGERRLTANIEYAAQAALDGSGLVYQMDGAEPLIYRLATAGGPFRTASRAPAAVPPAPVTEAPPPAAAEPPPVAMAAPEPAPRIEAEPAPVRVAARPSFNCARARTRSERMVCGSGTLAAQDRQMSSLFYSSIASADPATKSRIRASRGGFLARRERCATEACVSAAYQARIAEIRRMAEGE